jgi:hypothetical protein
MYLANAGWLVGGDIGEEGLDRIDELGVKFRDERIVILLLRWLLEGRPWELINIPEVVEVDIGEFERYRALGLGERCDEEVRP